MTSKGAFQPQPFCDSSDGHILLNLHKSVNKGTVTSFLDLVEIRVSEQCNWSTAYHFSKAGVLYFLDLRTGALSQLQSGTTNVQTY